MNYKNCW